MAAILNEQFVCAWEKKGAVESYRVKGAPEQNFKVGGNILTYVCSARGEVIHAIPGACKPEFYRQELEWARTVYRESGDLKARDAVARVRDAHQERQALMGSGRLQQAHGLLSTQAMKPIAAIERTFFETLLGETYAPEKEIIIREIDEKDFKELLANMPRG